MHIHIGNRITISDTVLIGIFNCETLKKSDDNSFYTGKMGTEDKTIVVDENNSVYTSGVSPFTVLKRITFTDGIVWRRKDDQGI